MNAIEKILNAVDGNGSPFKVCPQIMAQARAELAALREVEKASLALTNYFEVYTADTGRTSRGEEVYQASRAALKALARVRTT